MLCAKFGWNWPSDSVEDFYFFKFRQCIFAISFSKHLNKLEFPSYKNALCHVMLELAQWRFFKFCYCIFAISLSSPLGKGRSPSIESPEPKCQFGWNWLSGCGEDDGHRQIVIRKGHLNLRLRWAKKQESNSRPLQSYFIT